MNNKYFELARNEERSGNDAAHCFFISPLFVTVAITAPGTALTVS